MKKHNSFLLKAIVLIGIMILFVMIHEQLHMRVFNDYGIKAHYDYSNLPWTMRVVAEEPCPGMCMLTQHIIETVHYAFQILYMLIIIIYLFKETKE